MVIREIYQSSEDEKKLFEWIDRIIEFFPKYEKDIFASVIHKMNCKEEFPVVNNIGQTMLRLNIFEKVGDHFIQFSSFGQEIKAFGNYTNYLKHQDKIKQLEIYKQKKEIENLESSIKVNEWLVRTRWWPHILALIALIFSALALFL
ncbi:hypothetical protein [Flavobacterium silvaticum]|uniref:Uncharacterized protein n=1 Tax=Flavobacterium silvaticum TaxID=1852020 RepID=A0A972FIG1_9FLAO|nr:hypothetical protein [Flavobacterium silvaticum]NMH26551.1 hypothetical protein [Flavobacterium silvaticum]